MIPIIIVIISLLLDGLLTNYLPFMVNDLSFFTPLLTLVSIIVIYPFYRKKEKNYFISIFIIGIIYDLFYTNLLFLDGILFFILGFVIKYLDKNFGINFWKLIIFIIIIITIYESLIGVILFLFRLVPVTLGKVLYKIIHSILGNIIYGELLLMIINIIPKKYKKISIN